MSLDVYLEIEVNTGGPEPRTFLLFEANCTHNLNKMADEAGIYHAVWEPNETGIKNAGQLIEPLRRGIALMESDPERFKKFNPANGWGEYESFLVWLRTYLRECEDNPLATVSVSR